MPATTWQAPRRRATTSAWTTIRQRPGGTPIWPKRCARPDGPSTRRPSLISSSQISPGTYKSNRSVLFQLGELNRMPAGEAFLTRVHTRGYLPPRCILPRGSGVLGLAAVVTHHRLGADTARWCRTVSFSIGGQQGQPLALRQVSRRHHKKVPPVKGRDFAQAEPLGQRDHACVHDLQRQGRGGGQQLSNPPEIMRGWPQ